MDCNECIARLRSIGDDPRVKSGRYNLCGCDYCNKPQNERDIELPKQPEAIDHSDVNDRINRTNATLAHLQRKMEGRYTNKYSSKGREPESKHDIKELMSGILSPDTE